MESGEPHCGRPPRGRAPSPNAGKSWLQGGRCLKESRARSKRFVPRPRPRVASWYWAWRRRLVCPWHARTRRLCSSQSTLGTPEYPGTATPWSSKWPFATEGKLCGVASNPPPPELQTPWSPEAPTTCLASTSNAGHMF